MEDNKNLDTQEVVKEEETQVVETKVVESEDGDTTKTQVVEEEVTTETSKSEEEPKPTDQVSDGDEDDDDEDNDFTKALKKVRNEAKNLRTRLKEANETIAELQKTTDTALVEERDTLKRELDELKTQVRNDKISGFVSDEAKRQGAIEPSIVAKLIDLSKVELDDEGKPTNLKEMVTATRNEYKRLFTGVVGSGNTGNRDERGAEYQGSDAASLLAKGFRSQED